MKYLILFTSLIFSTALYSQDTLHIPSNELEEFFLALDNLKAQDSIQTAMIKTYEDLLHSDSMLLREKDHEIEQLNIKLNQYEGRLDHLDKWYRTPWFGVGTGIIGTALIFRLAGE